MTVATLARAGVATSCFYGVCMSKLSIDFESRSRIDLKACGMYRYAEDPSTEILCVAWAFDDDEPEIWLPGDPIPFWYQPDDEIHAWNAAFERVMWYNILHKRLKWPLPEVTQWRCTAVKAAYANMPRSLGGCSRAFDLHDDGKSAEGHKVMLKLCSPDRKGNWVEDADLFEQLYDYCKQDVIAERAIGKLLPDWPQAEIDKFHIDCLISDRGVPLDVEMCKGGVKVFEDAKKTAAEIATSISGGTITAGTQRDRILKFVNERGVNIGNMQKETIAAVLESDDLDDDCRAMLELRQSVSGAAASKYPTALNRVSEDGRIRGAYMFYGAHTGRRSSPGLQLQNMKNCFEVEPCWMEAIRSGDVSLVEAVTSRSPAVALGDCVRGLVCAPEGKTFVFADLNQIEVRLAHWLSGSERGLDLFRQGLDPYKEYGKKFFKVKEVVKAQRQFSKAPVLGGQYGMGPTRLRDYALAFGVTMSAQESDDATKSYREQNPEIVKFWSDVDTAVHICVEQKRPVKLRHLRFEMFKDWLEVHLPSGRSLFYRYPGFSKGRFGQEFSYEKPAGYREKSWGGVFLENFCQGLTRDLLAITERSCYTRKDMPGRVVIDQHDEIGIETDLDKAEETRDKLMEIMCITPSWAKGLPIEAEAEIKKRFLK